MTEPYGRRWVSPTNRIHGAQPGLAYRHGDPIPDGWLLFCTSRPVGHPWRMVFDNEAAVTCKRCLAVAARMAEGIRSEYDL